MGCLLVLRPSRRGRTCPIGAHLNRRHYLDSGSLRDSIRRHRNRDVYHTEVQVRRLPDITRGGSSHTLSTYSISTRNKPFERSQITSSELPHRTSSNSPFHSPRSQSDSPPSSSEERHNGLLSSRAGAESGPAWNGAPRDQHRHLRAPPGSLVDSVLIPQATRVQMHDIISHP